MWQELAFCQQDRSKSFMPLIFRNPLQLSQKLIQVINCGIGDPVFKIKMRADSSRDSNLISLLILIDHLPKGIGAKWFLEANGHDLALPDLYPFNSIYNSLAYLLSFLSNLMLELTTISQNSYRLGSEQYRNLNMLYGQMGFYILFFEYRIALAFLDPSVFFVNCFQPVQAAFQGFRSVH